MKLKTYIKQHGIKGIDFAKQINCSQPAVSLYIAERRTPRPQIALRIVEATNGEVTLEDLYSTPAGKTA